MLDMLTADAASKHEHEPSQLPSGNGAFFSQMPLSFLGSVLRKQSPSPASANVTPTGNSDAVAPPKAPMISPPATPVVSPTPSRAASLSSIASAEGRPRKRASRPKTTYNLAQPPPITGPRHKLHLRPKVLLQLHQVIPSRRPKPVYEVIPFSLLAPRSHRRLARTFNTRDRLCPGPSDLLVVKAETYEASDEDDKTDDERWGSRDVLGLISPSKKGDRDPNDKTMVLMDDGCSWEVTNMPNGGYEFSYTDEHGLSLKRRWIPKPAHLRRVSTMSNSTQPLGSPTLGPEDKKFNFSTISANSRRHPVIATMSRLSIDVLESYAMPAATSPPTPGLNQAGFATPLPTPSSVIDTASFLDKAVERLPVKTDDALRNFIVLSGIWVAFSENWSPAYSWSRHVASPYMASTPTNSRPLPSRTVSMSILDSPRSVSPASTIDEQRRAVPKIFRSGSQKVQNSTSSTSNLSSATTATAMTSPSASPIKTRSRRSNSTGNAEFTRRTGSTRKRFGLGLEDSLVETEEERQSKRSLELLRIKELALPENPSSPPRGLTPLKIIEPPSEFRSPSPATPNARFRKVQSAYNPVKTAGLWDSGVADGPGLKVRPTSLVVVNEKKQKAKRKQERSKTKDKVKVMEKEKEYEGPLRRSGGFRQRFLGIFRREKK